MPQSQTAANPRHQEEEKKDKNIHAQNKQTNARDAQSPAPSSPGEVSLQLHHSHQAASLYFLLNKSFDFKLHHSVAF